MHSKGLIIILFISCIALLLITQNALSSGTGPIWVGRITIDYNLSNSLNKDTSDKDSKSTHKLNETAHFRAVIKACGESAQNLRIENPDVSYTMTENRLKQVKKSKCVRPSKGPGDRDMVDYIKSGTPKSYQKFETEAYCIGLGIILNYAAKNCRKSNLKAYEKEYQRLCSGH